MLTDGTLDQDGRLARGVCYHYFFGTCTEGFWPGPYSPLPNTLYGSPGEYLDDACTKLNPDYVDDDDDLHRRAWTRPEPSGLLEVFGAAGRLPSESRDFRAHFHAASAEDVPAGQLHEFHCAGDIDDPGVRARGPRRALREDSPIVYGLRGKVTIIGCFCGDACHECGPTHASGSWRL